MSNQYTAPKNEVFRNFTNSFEIVTALSKKIKSSVKITRKPTLTISETATYISTVKPKVKKRLNKFLETNLRLQLQSTSKPIANVSASKEFKMRNIPPIKLDHMTMTVEQKPSRIIRKKIINIRNDTTLAPPQQETKGKEDRNIVSNDVGEAPSRFVENEVGDGPNEFVDVATSDIAYTDSLPNNSVMAAAGSEKEKGNFNILELYLKKIQITEYASLSQKKIFTTAKEQYALQVSCIFWGLLHTICRNLS